GVLLEHYAGNLPLWLAPVQAVVMNITDKQADYVTKLVESLKKLGIRAIADLRNEKIGFKIRERTLQKIPYLLVVGDREQQSNSVAVRKQSGEDLGVMSVSSIAEKLADDIKNKR